ncbi:ABC transporter permease [Desulfonatronovibrio hydrogenovorans]|uniref:ABC transporter permease n=1 Tax=Desulfonatronovibrio hydrogenovorans TaxID=53245 RepID=UPI0005503371|nr:ABC transporter permease [Desulfonatronovibrio hydrogenovorans]
MKPFASLIKNYQTQISITIILLIILGIFTILSPRTFLSPNIYIAYMSIVPFAAIIALSLTLVIVSGEIDLSFPSLMLFSGFIFSQVFSSTGSVYLALGLALLSGSMLGLINGIIVVFVGVPSIIATIGTQFFWNGFTMVASSGLAVSLVPLRDTSLHTLFVGRLNNVFPMQALWAVLVAVFLWIILNRHKIGDNIRFIGDNINTARMMGLPIRFTKMLCFVQLGFFSALSSVMVCLEMANWWPTQGEGYLLPVFAAIFVGGTSVFGGTGTIYGTFIGAIIIGIIEAGIISSGFSGFWTRMVYGTIVILSVSFYAYSSRVSSKITY